MQFGIQGSANQQFAVDAALSNVEQMARWQRMLPSHWTHLAQPGSHLDALLDELPRGPVDLRETLFEGLWAGFTCLEEVASFARQERGSASPPVLTVLRTAMLAGSRVIYAIAPSTKSSDQLARATTVMAQEAASVRRLYEMSEGYRDAGIVNLPPQVQIDERLELAEELLAKRPFFGDAKLLEGVATVTAELLEEMGQGSTPDITHDLLWLFNVGSGVAHGLGWPSQLLWVGSFPTNLPRDFLLATIIVDHAHQLVLEESGIGTGLKAVGKQRNQRRARPPRSRLLGRLGWRRQPQPDDDALDPR